MNNIMMMNGAKRLVEINAGLKKDEKALIVCDTENIDIARAMAYAVKAVGAEYTLAIMEPRQDHGQEPTSAVAKAMLGVDVVFAPTKFSLSHSQAREGANEHGVRFISMPDYSRKMMEAGAIEADFIEIKKIVSRLSFILTNSSEIQVTTPAGTRISMVTKNRIANEVSGVCREKGTWGSPPNIEVNVSPVEELTEGIVVVDGSIPMPEIGIVEEPITLTIERGRIVQFAGGPQSQIFEGLLAGQDDPANLTLAEFGIGLNDRSRLTGSMLEDEGAYGTAHFGFGHNFDQGGRNKASKHIDCVYKAPTITVDGKVIMKDGVLTA